MRQGEKKSALSILTRGRLQNEENLSITFETPSTPCEDETETRKITLLSDTEDERRVMEVEDTEEEEERRVMEVEEEERAHEVGIPQRRIVMIEGQTSQGQRRSEPMVLDIPPEQDDREASIIDIESDDEQEQDGEIQLEARVYRDIQGNTRVYGKHGYAI